MSLDIEALRQEALDAVCATTSTSALEETRVQWLGKKGRLTAELKAIAQLSIEEKKAIGKSLNELKLALTDAIESRKDALKREEMSAQLAQDVVDISLPVVPETMGTLHPITRAMQELIAIFADFGFAVAEGPHVEEDFYNFTALNIPESHPARQMHDTFYVQGTDDQGNPKVLRTHTSPVQIRTMLNSQPPIRIIAPGSTFRCDSDMTHTPMFHQIEGLVIDKTSTFAHLKGLLRDVVEAFFGVENIPVRFRPSYFPFTEPSAEVDIGCKKTRDALLIGQGDDWLEILGCGMVHPNVLRHCNLDPEEWQGFAFGMGIERLAMLKYNIPDLRKFFESDIRWLQHYGTNPLASTNLAEGL